MPNVMAALLNIGGALCSTPQSLAECHAVTLLIYDNARLGRKVNFAPSKILSGARGLENVYTM